MEKISGDLVAYMSPEFFQDEFKAKITPGKGFDKEKVEKYYLIVMSINWFVKKVSKYELYFSEFYPHTESINNYEALEHHIHAYLEDIETLKNKLLHYVGCLRNDLKKVAINKDEVSDALDFLKNQIFKTFESTSDIRSNHRHKGSRFVDSNIVDGEIAEYMLSDKNILKDRLTPYAIELFEKQKVESFEKAKTFWVENAKKNLSQVNGASNEVLEKTKGLLYDLLDISPLDFLYKQSR